MIFYDEEVNVDVSSDSEDSSTLTYEDIYNAVYNGYIDAYTEIKIQESEQKIIEKHKNNI